MKLVLLAAALLLLPFGPAAGQARVFDSHVHLWHGEASLSEYEAQLKTAGVTIAGFGGMWFGGPTRRRREKSRRPACTVARAA